MLQNRKYLFSSEPTLQTEADLETTKVLIFYEENFKTSGDLVGRIWKKLTLKRHSFSLFRKFGVQNPGANGQGLNSHPPRVLVSTSSQWPN